MSSWTRLVRFEDKNGKTHLGQPVDDSIDVGLSLANKKDVEVFIIEGDLYTGTVTEERAVIHKLLSPVSRQECSFIRCLGLNYKAHVEEFKMDYPAAPILFVKSRQALTGPGEIKVPKFAQDQLDFETELAIVIGKDCRDVSEEEAMDYVLGATASNDVSARKAQFVSSQWCFGKGLDNSCPIGPVLVRTGAMNPDKLDFHGKLSGEIMQESNTSDMIFSCKVAVSFLSQGTTLEKGTIIQMGTPSGIGWQRKPQRTIKDGEEMRIWFGGGIGTLVNKFAYA